jgi:hypothetical protein
VPFAQLLSLASLVFAQDITKNNGFKVSVIARLDRAIQ